MKFNYIRRKFTKLFKKISPFRFALSCGIVGYIGENPSKDFLINGLEQMLSRGYDSAGISTINTEELDKNNSKNQNFGFIQTTKVSSVKSADCFEILKEKIKNKHLHTCGIGHTRWATHGAKNDKNAHPHTDSKNKISLVHNGTIENEKELKKALKKKGIKFISETDSEVIVQLLSYHYTEMKDIVKALSKSISELTGTFGLAIICSDYPNQILAVQNGSSMLVGLGKKENFVGSEYSAFAKFTRNYITLNDGEIAVIKYDSVSVDTENRLKYAPNEIYESNPSPYDHWTLKEIMNQPEAIERALNFGGRIDGSHSSHLGGFDKNKSKLNKINHLVISGCGSSFFSGLFGAKIMREMKSFKTIQVELASELKNNCFTENSAMLAISQSGETRDVIKSLLSAMQSNITVFSIVNVPGSLISRKSKFGIFTNAGRELGVASTKSFVTQCVVLTLISIWFANLKNKINKPRGDLSLLEKLTKNLLSLSSHCKETLKCIKKCKKISKAILNFEHCFVLAKGFAEPIAREGALKIKEMCYIHAEAFSTSELKHGPFALIEKGTPVFLIALENQNKRLVNISAREIASRGGQIFLITDLKEPFLDEKPVEIITIPNCGYLTAILCVIPFQFIGYFTAIEKGLNPDKPRNLAKSVTVD